jgi:hypothetical protein
MRTKLLQVKEIETEVEFERTDGTKIYKIRARWDASRSSWFQAGAPAEVLSDNVPDVQDHFYKKRAVNFKELLNA